MSIEIDPRELCFQRPLTSEISQILKIVNPNDTAVAFKVKTTAPKQYCVRPNSGRIEPGQEVKVIVLLQAMKKEPPPNTKCRDKFLVQSVAITRSNDSLADENTSLCFEDAEKSAIKETRIRVVYLDPQTGNSPAMKPADNMIKNSSCAESNDSEGVSPHGAHRSPSPEMANTPDNRSSNRQTFGINTSVNIANSPPKTRIIPSTPTHEVSTTKLIKTEDTTANSSRDEGLRRRKGSNGEVGSDVTMKLEQNLHYGSQGVPLQIVAALCLMSFLIAYILF